MIRLLQRDNRILIVDYVNSLQRYYVTVQLLNTETDGTFFQCITFQTFKDLSNFASFTSYKLKQGPTSDPINELEFLQEVTDACKATFAHVPKGKE